MQSYTRHKLKEDAFAEATRDTVSWAADHRAPVILTVAVVILVLAAALGSVAYANNQHQKASDELGKAMRLYSAPLRAPGQSDEPGVRTFVSAKDRAAAAYPEFKRIADNYGANSHALALLNRHAPAEIAAYMAGIAAMETGDQHAAELNLKNAAGDTLHKDTAALAKLALASLYQNSGRESEAIAAFKELIDHPTNTVPKLSSQMQLAQLYEAKQPSEAIAIYQRIKIEDPLVGARLADQRLNVLKPGPLK